MEELWSQDNFDFSDLLFTYWLMLKIFATCTTRHLEENSLKVSAQSI